MKKLPYILKDLSIRKMPGFPRGLESLNDLAANVNIITGSNASGKSSTARAIQQLIWNNDTKGLEVEGSAILDMDAWEIKIDSGRTLIQRNGNEDQIVGLPAPEGQHRYLLALHNLVEGREMDLAKEIAKQSIGGFDLDAAQENLQYSSKISNKGISEYKKFIEAERKYKTVRDQQRELKKDETNLVNLELDKKNAKRAARQSDFYDKVADYLEAKLAYDQLADRIKEFSTSMANLTGDEDKRIADYESSTEDCKNNISDANAEIQNSRTGLKNLTIPEAGISGKTLNEIEERLERLNDFERDLKKYKKQIEGLKSQESIALAGFGEYINPEGWRDLTIDDVGGLDKMLKDAHQVLGEREFLICEIGILDEQARKRQNDDHQSDTLTQGIKTLSEWLKEPTSGSSGISLGLMVVIALAGIATGLATYYFGLPGLSGLVLILILFLYGYLAKGKSSNSLNIRENDFIKSGLKAPSLWNVESVTERIDELIESLKNNKEADGIAQRLQTAKDGLNKLQSRIDSINTKRQIYVDKLQAAPGFPENNSNDFSSLYWFLQQVKKWQDAYIQRTSLEAQNEEVSKQYAEELRKVNASFKDSNFEEVKDTPEAKATFIELKNQEETRKNQTRIIEQKEKEIQAENIRNDKAAEKLSSIYKNLNLVDHDKDGVRELLNQLEDFKQTSKDHYSAHLIFVEKESRIEEHSLFNQENINALTIDLSKEKAIQNKVVAEGLEDIQKQITEINTLIQAKKKGHELEDILTEKEQALDDLQQLFENNLSSVTGDLILAQLKKETQNKNRPKVFKRANEIFNKITTGRYELLLADKGEANFRAYDTVLKLGQNLSELSTGTRVQLLISVRLAYVETVESAIKLPLLADELLANSDDERAKAIIESLIEISREGRQVFYFTAQADEVNKWMHHLNGHPDLDHKVFQLNGGSNKSGDYPEFKPDIEHFSLSQTIPEPNGKSHREYGDLIGKQSFNVLLQKTSELPLWYLIEDIDLLYDCLTGGIKIWGQLESFYRNAGKIQNLDDLAYNQLLNKIELLKRFQELFRRGRSLPIDRDVIESSGTISAAFMDRVADKLNEFNREPKQLIHALKTGAVPRFRVDNADELEQYLMTKGYIDDQDILEQEEILIRVQAFISNSGMRTEDAENFINRILKSSN